MIKRGIFCSLCLFFFDLAFANADDHSKKNGMICHQVFFNGIEMTYPKEKIQDNFTQAIEDFYMKSLHYAFDNIINITLSKYNITSANLNFQLKNALSTSYIQDVQVKIIFLYTTDILHKNLNRILYECDVANESKFMSPYAAALMAVLTHWDGIKPTSNFTYRGADVVQSGMYKEGDTVVWKTFSSSSLNRTIAENFIKNTLFIIDNRARNSGLQPKVISMFSAFREEEAIYLPGAVFHVSSLRIETIRNRNISVIELLLDKDWSKTGTEEQKMEL